MNQPRIDKPTAAALLGLLLNPDKSAFSVRTITNWQRRATPHFKNGRGVSFDPSKITKWAEARFGRNE